jgi:putative two-component system response regulator
MTPNADSEFGPGTARAWVYDQLAGPFGGSRILIVDDDASVARTLSRVLRRAGLTEIKVCADPDEGAAWCEAQQPDLVFLDLHLPGWDGFQVLDRLRALTSGGVPVPIVMLTGDGDVRQKRRALAQGAADFLLKPFDAMEVILRTRALLQTQGLQRQLREQNRTLEVRVAERTEELEASQLEMLGRLAVAAELHDDATGQHTQRVGVLAGRLARALGLSDTRVELIARAAPLHDLGKVGVPDMIVQKPGKLTDQEYDVIKTHAEIGARILAGGHSELIQMAERIARHHHERWDGAGYPAGLAGDAIPLEARIVGAVDFFDALTHERPYRPAVSLDRTLAMISEGSGSHFDPAVAAALLKLVVESGASAPEDTSETRNEVAA